MPLFEQGGHVDIFDIFKLYKFLIGYLMEIIQLSDVRGGVTLRKKCHPMGEAVD